MCTHSSNTTQNPILIDCGIPNLWRVVYKFIHVKYFALNTKGGLKRGTTNLYVHLKKRVQTCNSVKEEPD